MTDPSSSSTARVVLPCDDLQETLDFYIDVLGFRLDRIAPADDPRSAWISGHGLSIELERGSADSPGHLKLACDQPEQFGNGSREVVAPGGTRIEFVEAKPPLVIPAVRRELIVNRFHSEESDWVVGRAGMRYRDLIPGRLGGHFIASHIQITEGGPVPDFVHFHDVRFQMIYCAKGWVRVVYEDQGEPIRLEAGDCFLQPPLIRHRVLECSPGLEVIELTCPAEHDTFVDHELELPTGKLEPDRDFAGQRFVYHESKNATWSGWRQSGFESRELGIAAATAGLATARVVRSSGSSNAPTSQEPWEQSAELLFLYVLGGTTSVEGVADVPIALSPGDSIVVPKEVKCLLTVSSSELELLEVTL